MGKNWSCRRTKKGILINIRILFELLETKTDLSKLETIAKKIAYRAEKGDLFLLKGQLNGNLKIHFHQLLKIFSFF